MTRIDMKESFVMYGSFLKAAEQLNGEEFKECILKLRDYALYGEDLDSENQLVNTILIMAKPNLKAAADRYKRCVENGAKGKEYGITGGRPKKGETRAEYQERKRVETPRKPLNDDVNQNVDDDETEKENDKDNWNMDVLSGGTSTVPKPLLVSSSVFSKRSNPSNVGAGASKATEVETMRVSLHKSPATTSNSAEMRTKVDYYQEIQDYLTVMAKYALGIVKLEDFDEVFARAVQCYMDFKGVSKAEAAKAIEEGIINYKEGIQNRVLERSRLQEIELQEDEENEEPF